MTDPARPDDSPRVGWSLLAGAALVVAYSTVGAMLKLYVSRQALGPGSADPTMRDMVRLVLAGQFLMDLLQGPVLWIVGSMLLWCGLAIFDDKRSFRCVLAATGIPFAAPTVALVAIYVALSQHPRPSDVLRVDILIAWVATIGLASALAWTVVRLRALGVEVDRGAAAAIFAAAMFVLGKYLPALVA